MEDRDALRVLGLSGPASPGEVKSAYRRLARDLHPDAGGSVEEFRDVQAAFEALRHGTDVRASGPAPQTHAPAVDDRWWEGPGAWHEGPVAHEGLDLSTPLDAAGVRRADVGLVARLVLQREHDWRLVSRAPGAWLNRAVALLDTDLVASLSVAPATDGRRPGHDLVARLRAPGGKGRRVASQTSLPAGWVRSVGSDSVELERRLRPSRAAVDTAVRAARALEELCTTLGWPLEEWSLVATGDGTDG